MRSTLCTVLALLCASQADALVSYSVSNVQTQIVGPGGSAVPGSGSSGNYDSNTVVGDFAVFDIFGANTEGPDFNAQLRVTYAQDNGGIGSNIMIAQTTNSQGLTDTGTFSVLMTIGTQGGGARLDFDWFLPGTYTGSTANFDPETQRINPAVNFTTFDIDFEQFVSVERAAITEYTLNDPTQLTATDNGSTITFSDSGSNSTVTDPTSAAEYLTRPTSSYYVDMGKQVDDGPALFMFEMRDPSDNVTINGPPVNVPEPGSYAALFGLATLALLGYRRRCVATT
ncbi:MAG: PEP-CTERM sorting domain-containing protein [Verrucomicrobiota bacterium]